MKTRQVMIGQTVIAILAVLAAPAAFAQGGMGRNMRMPRYDTSTVVTIQGTIQEVQEGTMQPGAMGRMSRMGGLHLTVKAEKETVTVLAGPASFAKDKGFSFAKDDKVEVTGSRVTYNGTKAIIAREIKKGGKTLVLRNEDGVPKWSRGPRQ
jgi:hypothetical protein